MLEVFSDLFSDEIGVIKLYQCFLKVKENTKPVFVRASPIPFVLKERTETEIEGLEQADIMEKVTYSAWRTPVGQESKKMDEFIYAVTAK